MRRKFRRLGDSTNRIRDAEVQLDVLSAQRDCARSLEAQLRAEIRRYRGEMLAHLVPEFSELVHKVRRRLPSTRDFDRLSMHDALKKSLQESDRRLRKRLGRIHSVDDRRQLHKARISAKRLRYLIEPFEQELAGGQEAVRELKSIQDLLGKLHDAQGLAMRLGDSSSQPSRNLAEQLQARERELFGRFERRWIRAGARRLTPLRAARRP